MGPKKDAGLKRGAEKKGNGGVRKKAKKVKTAEEEEAEIWEQVQQAHELDADIPTSPESEVSDEPEDEEIDDEEVDDEELEDENETEEKKVDVKKVDDEEVDDEEVDDEEVDDEEVDDEEIDDEELEDEDEAEEVDEKKVDVKKVDDEEVDDEEVDDEELDDEEEDDEEGEKRELLFEFGAWPPDKGDEDGLVNILTQTFLRTDIDVKGAADLVIENSPHGTVIVQGPGPEEEGKEKSDDDEFDGMLYGLFTTLDLNKAAKDDAPKFVKDLFAYLLNKAKKGAPSEFYKRLEEIQSAADGKTALFINDRLLNFSPLIVPKSFSLLQDELDEKKMDYKTFIYIQKIRIAEGSDGSGSSSGKQDGEPPKKKGKMGKAEKKRAAAAALANADIEFDNVEDSYLFKLTTGTETHFDYPVHMDVEPGSKFHVVEKNGKKWNPFRRVVIMDANRMRKFLENGAEAIVESD